MPFAPGWTDASAEQTNGFRNFVAERSVCSAEELLVDRSHLLTLIASIYAD